MASVIQNIADMVGYFGDALGAFPTSVLLLLVGFVLVVFPSLVMAYIVAGAIIDLIVPENVGRPPAQQQ